MKEELVDRLKEISTGTLGAKIESLWNAQGIGLGQGRDDICKTPRDYWCATVNGKIIGYEDIVGWRSKKEALEAAAKFQICCVNQLAEMETVK